MKSVIALVLLSLTLSHSWANGPTNLSDMNNGTFSPSRKQQMVEKKKQVRGERQSRDLAKERSKYLNMRKPKDDPYYKDLNERQLELQEEQEEEP
ncbi:MAG: hypothetical protein KGQ59_11975 [Bdellovibrionales bacterium]|nr:hypothetical protein [Bdellovibrionales bacterium]